MSARHPSCDTAWHAQRLLKCMLVLLWGLEYNVQFCTITRAMIFTNFAFFDSEVSGFWEQSYTEYTLCEMREWAPGLSEVSILQVEHSAESEKSCKGNSIGSSWKEDHSVAIRVIAWSTFMLANAGASHDLAKLHASQNDNENMWKLVKRESRLGSGIRSRILTFTVF